MLKLHLCVRRSGVLVNCDAVKRPSDAYTTAAGAVTAAAVTAVVTAAADAVTADAYVRTGSVVSRGAHTLVPKPRSAYGG